MMSFDALKDEAYKEVCLEMNVGNNFVISLMH